MPCCPVLDASGGRAFLLFAFASRAARGRRCKLRACDAPWPLFVQGTRAASHVLLQRFRDSGNGVLLGAASFREGVDVAGDALSGGRDRQTAVRRARRSGASRRGWMRSAAAAAIRFATSNCRRR
jgi:hypothetical protein